MNRRRRFIAIVGLLLVLPLSMSFRFHTHYCGGEAVNQEILLFAEGSGCGMMVEEGSAYPSDHETLRQKSCCEDVSLEASFKPDAPTVESLQAPLITAFIVSSTAHFVVDLAPLFVTERIDWPLGLDPPPREALYLAFAQLRL